MICTPCRTAGKKLAQAKLLDEPEAQQMLRKATKLHDKCIAPKTCPCHHHVTLDKVWS